MNEGLEAPSPTTRSFLQYIKDVIEHYTPRAPTPGKIPSPTAPLPGTGSWQNAVFGNPSKDGVWPLYANFVASLFGLRAKLTWPVGSEPGFVTFANNQSRSTSYSVVTLNYDSVLEDICSYISRHHRVEGEILFQRNPGASCKEREIRVPLAKLHGSVGTEEIIAPTWNKFLNQAIRDDWKMAHQAISEANHLRILGYSLPVADSYIRYLLKAAITKCQNLKRIDVLCKGEKARTTYNQFINFNFYRFRDEDIQVYLSDIFERSKRLQQNGNERTFDHIEAVHEKFMVEP